MATRVLVSSAVVALLVIPLHAGAWEIRTRFVEHTDAGDQVLPDGVIHASDEPRNIRFQIGVFDDVNAPAPSGGMLGWNHGVIAVSGPTDNSDEYRTPGRAFGPPGDGNGLPAADPFDHLTVIDARLLTQTQTWGIDEQGDPLPMPGPTIRGRNAFLSIYGITIDPRPGAVSYSITYSGDLYATTEWRLLGAPIPPIPPSPGSVQYEAVASAAQGFSATLQVVIPSPAGALLLIPGIACALRRRR